MRRGPVSELVQLYERLSSTARRALWALLGVELVVIAAVERDIQRRADREIRGPKLIWRAIATQNIIGPVAYLTFGRRTSR
jgi:hypothetical protein